MSEKEIGIREGEKLHEVMITAEDSPTTYEYDKYYIVYPQMVFNREDERWSQKGKKVPEGFVYSSGTNQEWLSVQQIQKLKQDVITE